MVEATFKKEIAKNTANFLKTRIEYSRDLLKADAEMSNIDLKTETLSFSDFISKVKNLKDEDEKEWYIRKNADKILYTDEEINELCSLVKEAMNNYDINLLKDNKMPFKRMINEVLVNYFNKLSIERASVTNNDRKKKIDSKLNVLMNWNLSSSTNLKYHYNRSYGIDVRIDGSIHYNEEDDFNIYGYNDELVIEIKPDGTVNKYDEDVLFIDRLFPGKICINDGNETKEISTMLLADKKFKKAKAIFYDNKTYPIFYEKPKSNISYIDSPKITLQGLLIFSDLNYLIDPIYKSYKLEKIVDIYNAKNKLTDEEKEQMEKTIDHAVDWWADAIKNPICDMGNFFGNVLGTSLAQKTNKNLDEDQINLFKNYLKNEIRGELLYRPNYFSLRVDYGPDIFLHNAAKYAKLNVEFPWKTDMIIRGNKIEVRAGYSANTEVIYDGNQDDNKPKEKKKDN